MALGSPEQPSLPGCTGTLVLGVRDGCDMQKWPVEEETHLLIRALGVMRGESG